MPNAAFPVDAKRILIIKHGAFGDVIEPKARCAIFAPTIRKPISGC